MQRSGDDRADLVRRTLLTMATLGPALAASGPASAAEPAPTGVSVAPSDLAKSVSNYDQATLRKDIPALRDLVAEDYVLVNSDSSVQNKEQYLADFEVAGFAIEPYVLQQPIVKVWGDTALTGGLLDLSWTQDGKHQRRLLRIAHVWVKSGGRWRISYTQLTRVPQN